MQWWTQQQLKIGSAKTRLALVEKLAQAAAAAAGQKLTPLSTGFLAAKLD